MDEPIMDEYGNFGGLTNMTDEQIGAEAMRWSGLSNSQMQREVDIEKELQLNRGWNPADAEFTISYGRQRQGPMSRFNNDFIQEQEDLQKAMEREQMQIAINKVRFN